MHLQTSLSVGYVAGIALFASVCGPVLSAPSRIVVWDGETAKVGAGWTNPTTSTIGPETGIAHSGNTALEFKLNGGNEWLGAGWNWCGWKKGTNVGTDTTGMTNLTFWILSKGKTGDLQVNLMCNGDILDTPQEHTAKVQLEKYCPNLEDGKWHEVVIPLKDLTQPHGYNPKIVSQIQMGFNAGPNTTGSFYIDDIAFEKN